MRVSKGYCTSCDRDVFRSPDDDSSCPVCSSTLIQGEVAMDAPISGPTRSHHVSDPQAATGLDSV